MGSLRKKDKRWYGRWREHGRQREKVFCESFKISQQLLRKIEIETAEAEMSGHRRNMGVTRHLAVTPAVSSLNGSRRASRSSLSTMTSKWVMKGWRAWSRAFRILGVVVRASCPY